MSSVMRLSRDLSGRGLSDLEEGLGEEIYRDGVTRLDISCNRLTSLPRTISHHFSNLLFLDISSNRLTEFPLQLCSLHRLQFLHAKHNHMKSLPAGFANLVSLKKLNLAGNGFEHFPLQLCRMEGLEYLHLGSNFIRSISPHVKGLKRLDYLYLGGNQLEDLPDEISELSQLTALILCDNKLTHLPKQLTKLSNLHSLKLHKNRLQTLPRNLIKLTNLQELSLRENPLVIRFIKEWPSYVPSLMEIAGNCIKKNGIPYSPEVIPQYLVEFLDAAQQCDNPMCKGVYFNTHFQQVKFEDFCGKYRVPLLEYLCSPVCVHEESCCYGHDCSHSSEEEEEAAKHKMKKVLLG